MSLRFPQSFSLQAWLRAEKLVSPSLGLGLSSVLMFGSDWANQKNANPEAEKPTDTQLHVLEECEAFDDIRQEIDINSDTGIVEYFKEIVKRRIQAGEE